MKTIEFSGEYFSVEDTLCCGQTFRFKRYKKGYLVNALDKCAYCYNENGFACIVCEDSDAEFFYNYFDLSNDYASIYNAAKSEGVEILINAAQVGKGIRILNQDSVETLFSFIISQNNNIPRIKGIIEKLCTALGDKREFLDQTYYAFPSCEDMAKQDLQFFLNVGLGYRAAYVKSLSEQIFNGLDVYSFKTLETNQLKEKLLSIYGVGPKVADCVTLFGFRRLDSFPVDTWIEKVYVEDFKGKEKDRKKMAQYFADRFKKNAGYFQQYLFHYKRSKEKKLKNKKTAKK